MAHGVDGGAIDELLVALAHVQGRGECCRLGDAHELHREVAIRRLALHAAIVDQARRCLATLRSMNAHVLAPLDVAAARGYFPALARAVAGQPAVYLDGPGGSQVPKTVIEAVAGYLERSNANLGGPFVTSEESIAVVDDARAAAADFTGARPEEIAFGPNMTTLNFLLAHAVARTLEPGDEIVVTQLDHDANVSPWLRVATDHELTVHTLPLLTVDGTIDLSVLEEHLASDRVAHRRVRAARRTRSARSRTPVASPTWRTQRARWRGPTVCTTRRTAASTATRWASTSCCARRTSSSARTSASPRSATTSPAAGRPTACARPRRSRRATASRRARSPTRRWRA